MSRVYVITESAVKVYNDKKKMSEELSLEKHELTKVGKDLVVNMTDQSFEIAKDIRLLETVASRKVFSKDKLDTQGWLIVIMVIMMVLVYTKVGH